MKDFSHLHVKVQLSVFKRTQLCVQSVAPKQLQKGVHNKGWIHCRHGQICKMPHTEVSDLKAQVPQEAEQEWNGSTATASLNRFMAAGRRVIYTKHIEMAGSQT